MEEAHLYSWMEAAQDPAGAERQRVLHSVAEAQRHYLQDAHAAKVWGWLPWFGQRLQSDWARSRQRLGQVAAHASLVVGELHLEAVDASDLALIKTAYDLELARCKPDSDAFPEIIGDGSEDLQ
jgi:hypothetical protein